MENFHNKGLVHRNINPNSFVLELSPKPKKLYIVDYGLSKLYIERKTKAHIPFREKLQFCDNIKYGSISSHKGYEQSRRDDLESLGYIFVQFMKGTLPWQKVKDGPTQNENVLKIKNETSLESLCKDLPAEFLQYLHYTRAIKFDDKPGYIRLKRLFSSLLLKKGFDKDFDYDWNKSITDVGKLTYTSLVFSNNENTGIIHNRASSKNTHLYKIPVRCKRKLSIQNLSHTTESEALGLLSIVSTSNKTDTAATKRNPTLNGILKYSEENCNFEQKDIEENISIIGKFIYILDDIIPDEKAVPMTLEIPVCKYIKNKIHFMRNRVKKPKSMFFSNKTIIYPKLSTKECLYINQRKLSFKT